MRKLAAKMRLGLGVDGLADTQRTDGRMGAG